MHVIGYSRLGGVENPPLVHRLFISMQLFVKFVLFFSVMQVFHAFQSVSFKRGFKLSKRFVSEINVEAFNSAKSSPIKMPCVVLVSPYVDGNVGSVSRAMLNFGMHDLRIVNPRCDILSETAMTLAVGSAEILNNAKVFTSLEDAIADLDIVVVTSARKHNLNQVLATPREIAQEIVTPTNAHSAGIVFGRERNGLTSEEIALANRRVCISTFEQYGVLNMAQAVNILSYECWNRKVELDNSTSAVFTPSNRDNDKPAEFAELNYFLDRILTSMGKSDRYRPGFISAPSQPSASSGAEGSSAEAGTEGEEDDDFAEKVGNGVSGFTLRNEARLKAIFRRVSNYSFGF